MHGPTKSLTDNQHPAIWLSPGKRDVPIKLYRGSFVLEEAADWLKKHVDNKFKMKTKDLDEKVAMVKYAQESGVIMDPNLTGEEQPMDIMQMVEDELKRRDEL